MSQKFNYFGFKAVMQYALNSALWYVYLYLKSVFIVKKNIFSSNFSLEEYGGNLKIVKRNPKNFQKSEQLFKSRKPALKDI